MTFARIGFALALAGSVAACGHTKFKTYDGPEVTQVQVYKAQRTMLLMHNGSILKTEKVSLGGNPVGPKQVEGDGKTPEGQYVINRRNPDSAFYLSLGISYPDSKDVETALSMGKSPGGDIFIHGQDGRQTNPTDWTAGCIAIPNKAMEDVYAMVKTGTPIFIMP